MNLRIYLAVFVAVLINAGTCIVAFNLGKNRQSATIASLQKSDTDSISHYKDLYGTEHALHEQAVADMNSIKLIYGNYLDSIKLREKIKEDQISSFNTVGTTASAKVPLKIDTTVSDGKSSIHLGYDDKWTDIDGLISDSSTLHYKVSDSLVISSYWKRSWLLGKKKYYIDAYSLNPNVHISGLKGVEIKAADPGRFSVGPSIGLYYSGNGIKPAIGLTLQYSIIRF